MTAVAIIAIVGGASAAAPKTFSGVKLVFESVYGQQCYRFVPIETSCPSAIEFEKLFDKGIGMSKYPSVKMSNWLKSPTIAAWSGTCIQTGYFKVEVGDMPLCDELEKEALRSQAEKDKEAIRIQLERALESIAPFAAPSAAGSVAD